jgi:hypothetical protein
MILLFIREKISSLFQNNPVLYLRQKGIFV